MEVNGPAKAGLGVGGEVQARVALSDQLQQGRDCFLVFSDPQVKDLSAVIAESKQTILKGVNLTVPHGEMCGNGVRCFARFIAELENLHENQSFNVHSGAGFIVPEIQEDGKVRVDIVQHVVSFSS